MASDFLRQWLEILCRSLPKACAAVFVSHDKKSQSNQLLAQWPDDMRSVDEFDHVIKYALLKNERVFILNVQNATGGGQCDYFALPLRSNAELSQIIVCKLEHSSSINQNGIFERIRQGALWLALANNGQKDQQAFYASVTRLQAACIEQKSYREALIVLVSEFTRLLNCERVALGEFDNNSTKVVALSNSAQFDGRANFVQKIADAMDEAIEQDCYIVFPNSNNTVIQRAHQELARKFGSGALVTVPMVNGDKVYGAITLFRSEDKPFDQESLLLCKQTMSLLTPYLALKKSEEQGLITIIAKKLKKQLASLLGFKHLKMKLATISLVLLMLATGVFKGDFQVTANAVLEGKIQRVVSAPIEGFLLSAAVRAGDIVREGDIMAHLDDADLQLELNKLNGQLQKFRREYREALSINDLVKVRVISAQIDQAVAEMALTQQQLQKITLTAPFDSVVIEGDLSQMLGSPVQRGDVLFKIAPLEGYRIILKVEERSIAHVKPGQKGLLALSSMPDRKFDLTVQKITAVAETDDQKTIFRVEASLDNPPDLLRPGMEGVGKINVGRRSLLWIGTHELLDWLRLWFWSWFF